MDDFSDMEALLTQLQKPAVAQAKHRYVAAIPDALVLGIVRTTCDCCKSVYEYPSSHLLVREGRNYKWSGLTLNEAKAGTPLEVRYSEVTNAHCLKCFPNEPTVVKG